MSSLQTTDCLKEKLFRDSRDIRDQNRYYLPTIKTDKKFYYLQTCEEYVALNKSKSTKIFCKLTKCSCHSQTFH